MANHIDTSKSIRKNSAQNSAMAELMINSIHDYAVFMLDPTGNVLSWNIGASRIMGYDAHEIIGRHFSCFYAEETRDNEPRRALEIASERRSYADEEWHVRKDGSRFWATIVIELVRGEAGQVVGFAEVVRDNTERRIAEDALRKANDDLERRVEERTLELNAANTALKQLADTDELTGIFNVRGFLAVAKHEIARASRYRTPLSILFLDIDKFKTINDTFGHAAGDRALKMVVKEMGRQLRDGDVMARIGGDEFVMLLLESTSEEAARVADRICEAVVLATTEAVGATFTTMVSVGVAQWTPNETIDELLAHADAALYAIKSRKKQGNRISARVTQKSPWPVGPRA
jgi:diguanylate cyclase (GGDEF)-like protein/PAS domain S-box-containing protein